MVSAVGQLSRPAVPKLPGREEFAGPASHSADWDHDVDLTGQRVAVLGTGAGAIQFVPEIAPVAGHATVFQRSAPYVVPEPDREHTGLHHRASNRAPHSQRAGRLLVPASLRRPGPRRLRARLTGVDRTSPPRSHFTLPGRAGSRAVGTYPSVLPGATAPPDER